MNTNTIKNIPVVPLRGLVVLPYSATSFDVGRKKSIAAVKAASRDGSEILLVAQKHDAAIDINTYDLYSVGCLCTIKTCEEIVKGGAMRLLVNGVRSAKIVRFNDGDYLSADIEYAEDEQSDPEFDERLREKLIEICEEFISFTNNQMLKTTLGFIGKTSNDIEFSYRVANVFIVSREERQNVLEAGDNAERTVAVINFIKRALAVERVKRTIDENVKEQIDKNQRDYILREQIKAVKKELGEDESSEADEFRQRLEDKEIPDEIRKKLEKEIERFAMLPAGSHETPSMRTYIDTMLSLPYTETSEDDLDVENARRILDEDHYGLKKVKDRIIEFISVARLTGKVNGQIICFVGPPGVGKTSISASIARALGRKFVRMSLGGIRDEAEIRGHRRTYIGAMPGRVITAMKTAGTVNPVLLFDEIDKLAQDIHGDPASAMLEVLDSAQNFEFRDHFLETPYDLSKVLFITTANNASLIPRPLLDRMEVIEVPSYLSSEKTEIALRHLIPRQLEKHGLTKSMLNLPRETVEELIVRYTRESGVRELERTVAAVCRKTACDIAAGKKRITVSRKKLEEYLGAPRYGFEPADKLPQIGIVNGLAWTSVGGETLLIEVAALPGTGQLQLTGQLGSVMQESAKAAITCVRERAAALGIDEDFYAKTDIHIHIPEGAVPKDGPSAGVAMMTAVASALSRIPVKPCVAMTGEISLRGRVLPIGGLREKLLAAARAGITTVLLPEKNAKDIADIPSDIVEKLNIVYISDANDALENALESMPKKRIMLGDRPHTVGAPA
ncbi:MAG: endopeptidase La [Clostridia bacterium]|nr:endopeptidase La [Clostridia bacterium]